MSVNWTQRKNGGQESGGNSSNSSFTHIEPNREVQGNGSLAEIHEHIASLERGIYEEVERRVASEDRIREQVDNKVKIAIERVGDATEMEMTRMYRRIEADWMNRVDQVSREVGVVSASLKQLSRQLEVSTVESRANKESLSRLERKMNGDGVSTSVFEAHRQELEKLKEMIETDLNNSKKIQSIDEYVKTQLTNRLETMETWLKSSLTPEILRLKEMIQAEKLNRETNDDEVLKIVSEYTEIMQKHFDLRKEST